MGSHSTRKINEFNWLRKVIWHFQAIWLVEIQRIIYRIRSKFETSMLQMFLSFLLVEEIRGTWNCGRRKITTKYIGGSFFFGNSINVALTQAGLLSLFKEK